MHSFGKIRRCLLAIISLCVLGGGLGATAFAADTFDMKRARQLREKQTSGQALTKEEKILLQQAREKISNDKKVGGTIGGREPERGAPPAGRPESSLVIGGGTYYVAVNGKDTNPGSLESPWATLAHALPLLRPGDTLNLRAGTYYELGLTTDLQGMADHPITIQSYLGERAIVDGAVPYFMELNKQEWILHNSAIDEYRSARTFPGNYVRVWLTDARMQIHRYENQTNMESTHYGPLNKFDPLYFGPGAQLRSDGHIYIRLSPNPNDQIDVHNRPIPPVPADFNPNHHRMAVSVAKSIGNNVILNSTLLHVTFQNLTFAHAKTLFDVKPGSRYLMFKNSIFLYGTYGINCRGSVTDLEIANSLFDNQVPYFLCWTDVKNEGRETSEGHKEFQSVALAGFSSNTRLHDNIIQNGFDGFQAGEGTNISVINNQLLNLHDDAMNFMTGSSGEVAHNLMWHVNSGISLLGSGQPAGELFIHHNVIDTTALRRGGRPGNYRAEVWPVWSTDTPFAHHGGGNKAAWWKLYNNTIIARAVAYGTPMNPFSLTANNHFYAVNNIFYAVDNRVIYREHQKSSGAVYDGNIVWQGSTGVPLFRSFGDGGTYDTLADFQARQTGWELHGQQTNPGFDLTEINKPDYHYPEVLKRYVPRSPAAAKAGYSYEGHDWPETAGVNYTGAFPPPSS